MKSLIKKLLNETLVAEFYGKKVIEPITKRFSDNSDDMINKLAVAFLFRQWFGDIMTYQSKQDFDNRFKEWYDYSVSGLIKTPDFIDNENLAKKYLDAYVSNIVSLGDAAKPFSFKNVEKSLVDLVNNNRWVKDEEGLVNNKNIYNPQSEDILYEDDNVLILNTDTKAKCVMYGRGETWCITKADSNYYNTYRLSYAATPYFVLQKNIKGNEHKIVIMNYGRRGYAIADRTNTGDRIGSQTQTMDWYQIEQELPNLSGLERYFQYREVTDDERKYSELLDDIKVHFKDEDLQGIVDKAISNLVVNGARVTSGDFIRDLAANQMSFTLEQLKSLRKETMDSLIESGYFVNLYYDTNLYEEVLSTSQVNRIIKLKIESDIVLSDSLKEKLPENVYKEYLKLRIQGHNNGVGNGWTNRISEKILDLQEMQMVEKFFPQVKLNTDRFDLNLSHELFQAIYIDPKIANTPEGRRHLESLDSFHIYMLLRTHPDLIKYFIRLPKLQEFEDWRYIDLLEGAPKLLKPILNNVTEEKKETLIGKLQHTNLLPLLIRDGFITINNQEEFNKLNYVLINRTNGKAFVYKPELLKFINKDNYELKTLLPKQPTLCRYLKDGVISVDNYALSDIIVKNPKTLDYIPQERIDEMSEYTIFKTIYNKPSLAPLLAYRINITYIIDLFKNVPKVIPEMPDNIVRQLDKYDMVSILSYEEKNKKAQYKYLEPIIDANMPQDKEFILSRI